MKTWTMQLAGAFWTKWEDRRLCGFHWWGSTPPRVGDELLCEMESGKTARFRFIEVEVPRDPGDQYFAAVEDIGYEDAKRERAEGKE